MASSIVTHFYLHSDSNPRSRYQSSLEALSRVDIPKKYGTGEIVLWCDVSVLLNFGVRFEALLFHT